MKNVTAPITGDYQSEIKQHSIEKISDKTLENTLLPGNGMYLLKFLCDHCSILPFDDFKVYRTTNYAAFSHLAENRDLNESHVHTLMESFQKDGYLFTIIYVNEKIEIVDGQHRFEAAKRKHLPIYFIVLKGWGITEVGILNVNSRNWSAEDFMNMHAKSGNPSYVRFKEFYDKHEFDITTAQLIILGRRLKSSRNDNDFNSGHMKIDNSTITRAFIKARKIAELKDFHPHGWKTRSCVDSLLKLLNTKGYDHGHMIEQLRKYPITMLMEARSLRTEEYVNLFVDKYNFRKKDKIEVG